MRSLERRLAGKLNIKTPPLVGGATVASSSSLKRRPTSADSRVRAHRVLSDKRANEAASPAKQKGDMRIDCAGWRTKSGGTPDKWWENCLGNSPQAPAIGIADGYKLKCTVVVPQLVLVDVRLAPIGQGPLHSSQVREVVAMEPRNGDARFSVPDAVSAVAEHFGVTRDQVLRVGLRRRIAAFDAEVVFTDRSRARWHWTQ